MRISCRESFTVPATTRNSEVRSKAAGWLAAAAILLASASPSLADGIIRFDDRAVELGAGFVHTEPPRNAILDAFKLNGLVFPDDLAFVPHKPHGAPGVAIFDFDRDGDLDIYVTNSVGSANGLFSNQLGETGTFGFVDVAAAAGVDATDHDSTGVCYGDLDNDGDHDLLVLGAIEPNRLYENRGGTFVDITAQAGVGGGNLSTSSCSMGDVDGDGLLDIAIANTHTDWTNLLGIVIPYTFSEHNQLFRNTGGNVFADTSAASGFETLAGFPPFAAGSAALTWAIALVDYDLDGDVDAFTLDDQGGVPFPDMGGVNYGIIHLHRNDGSGQFTDVTVQAGLDQPGNWMGISFGDVNCDGHMDFFGTNVGDYPGQDGPVVFPVGVKASTWFLGRPDGSFADPGVGGLIGTPFGWGNSIFDYDNDGDGDIAYVGAIDVGVFIDAGNPGVVLENQGCTATYTADLPALGDSGADHTRRVDQGLATGDLDRDGFVDVVTMSNSNLPESVPLTPRTQNLGTPWDPAFFVDVFVPASPADPFNLVWNGNEPGDGSLSVEINSGDNGNGWVELSLLGSAGILDEDDDDEGDDDGDSDGDSDSDSDSDSDAGFAVVNRDGIGAVVTFTPDGGKTSMRPIVGGLSFASQHSLAANFGLGDAGQGTAEVLWPGGVRNRLHDVEASERVLLPHIPCSFDGAWDDEDDYEDCVEEALEEYEDAGFLSEDEGDRLLESALRAFDEAQ